MLPWRKRHLGTVVSVCAGLGILRSYLWAYSLSGASAAPTILLHDTLASIPARLVPYLAHVCAFLSLSVCN